MLTYQDFLREATTDENKINFIQKAINQHTNSDDYKKAVEAYEYYRQRNTAIMQYQKILYTVTGKPIEDVFSANHKTTSNFFYKIITQMIQYSLGNGLIFENENVKEKFTGDIDLKIKKIFRYAAIEKIAFGFYNNGNLECFKVTEFAPLWDEEDGSLKAGIRFWQIDSSKPLRATLFELDGYTEYIREKSQPMRILKDKQKYIKYKQTSEIYGTEIFEGENYPTFPIIPAYCSDKKQSMLEGIKEQIDAYDFIKSGFANDLDDATQIYWLLQNTGGMDDVDLAKFMQRLKTTKIANLDADEGGALTPYTVQVPYQSREVYLERLEKDIYDDAMALNVSGIQAGNITATQIKAAYEDINLRADAFEEQVLEFMQAVFELAGVGKEKITFNRSKVANTSEEIQTILSTGDLLPIEYKIKKILALLGDIDHTAEVFDMLKAESLAMMNQNNEPEESNTEGEEA
uniref:PORTAL PROTEIN n=1 Tax=Siphoviridae sp. ctqzz19 TaxID=2825682 RepID=A0A8S5U278_9CAUD|nr:MAG TPA: PORTAL PROTEIN [Siphoviridae sp. ctqzz19]